MKRISKYTLMLVMLTQVLSCDIAEPRLDPVSEKLQAEIELIDKYLSRNGIQARVDESTGIRYTIDVQGDGLQPHYVDSLQLTMTGSVLATGTQYQSFNNEVVQLNQITEGAALAISKIKEGGKVTAYIPSVYGYGESGTDQVPPNSILINEIEFHGFYNELLRSELDVIDQYLADQGITPVIHSSGIRYTIEQGAGDLRPTKTSFISGTYSGWVLGEETPFDNNSRFNFQLNTLIYGWHVIIPILYEGGTIAFYLPSQFAYADDERPGIPANSILKFEVFLEDVR